MAAPAELPTQAPRARILVVEDDREIAGLVHDMLAARGYAVSVAYDGRALEPALQQRAADLVVLDLMLPGEDGLSLCARLRARYATPFLVVTALGSQTDRIVGLETGADDYIVKPFAPAELIARVRALLRRTQGLIEPATPGDELAGFDFGGWHLSLTRLSLTGPEGATVPLTSAEFSLLAALCRAGGGVVSREALLNRDGPHYAAAYARSIDTLIGRLRRKLHSEDEDDTIIRTVRGSGYALVPPVRRVLKQ